MSSVWVVEAGQYSDYHVIGVFSSREAAAVVANEVNRHHEGRYGYPAIVEKWPLDPFVAELNAGRSCFQIMMKNTGEVERVYPTDPSHTVSLDVGYTKGWITGTVWATSEKHAVKIANEYRIRAIAEGRLRGAEADQ